MEQALARGAYLYVRSVVKVRVTAQELEPTRDAPDMQISVKT